MEHLAPLGPVYQAGTLSGNPLAVTAGLETLKLLSQPESYEKLEELSRYLVEESRKLAAKAGVNIYSTRVGSMFSMFFTSEEVVDYDTAQKSDTDTFNRYFHSMLKCGFYLAPSQFEAGFLSLAHSQEDLDKTLDAMAKSFKEL